MTWQDGYLTNQADLGFTSCSKGEVEKVKVTIAAETNIGQWLFGKPFLIWNEIWDQRNCSAWLGEEGFREEVRLNRYMANRVCLGLGSG